MNCMILLLAEMGWSMPLTKLDALSKGSEFRRSWSSTLKFLKIEEFSIFQIRIKFRITLTIIKEKSGTF